MDAGLISEGLGFDYSGVDRYLQFSALQIPRDIADILEAPLRSQSPVMHNSSERETKE